MLALAAPMHKLCHTSERRWGTSSMCHSSDQMCLLEHRSDSPILAAGEGPVGLIICPSRELARQTYEVILGYTDQLAMAGHPQLHTLLCIGGIDMKEQTDKFRHAGLQVSYCALASHASQALGASQSTLATLVCPAADHRFGLFACSFFPLCSGGAAAAAADLLRVSVQA